MDRYKNLVSKLNEFLKKEDVVFSDNYISAYDLYNIIKEELEELKHINTQSSFIPKHYNLKIFTFMDEEYIKLQFLFMKKIGGHHAYIRNICKNRITNEYSFNDKLDLEFMREYEDEIKNIFDVEEKNYYKVGTTKGKNIKLFNDGIFDVVILFNKQGEVDIKVLINNAEKIKKLFIEHWYLYITLVRKIEKGKIDILKKFSINVNDLSDNIKLMLENYLSKEEIKIKRKKV